MAGQPRLTFNDGQIFPQLGFGTYKISDDQVRTIVHNALKVGYRHIDTAKFYQNEAGVGVACRGSGLDRADYKVTSKVHNIDHGYDAARRAIEKSAAALDLGAIDLMLIHWPAPHRGLYVDTWRALIDAQKDGQVTSIGVSNFMEAHLERIIGETGVVPVVNQVELHPGFQQKALRAFHQQHAIVTEAWAPLGRGWVADDPLFKEIGRKYDKGAVQVVLRWHIQEGLMPIPKSVTPDRIVSNFDVFDFTLDDDEIARIEQLDRGESGRTGLHPERHG